jgi:hypothetical protein
LHFIQEAKYYHCSAELKTVSSFPAQRDHSHSEGEINHRRCLRILGRWIPDQSSAISDSSSLDTAYGDYFAAYLENAEATYGAKELLASMRRLKSDMEGLVDRLTVKPDEDLRQNPPTAPRAVLLRELYSLMPSPRRKALQVDPSRVFQCWKPPNLANAKRQNLGVKRILGKKRFLCTSVYSLNLLSAAGQTTRPQRIPGEDAQKESQKKSSNTANLENAVAGIEAQVCDLTY